MTVAGRGPETTPAARGRGRPRSEEARADILQATRELLLEEGYTKLAITHVAQRAKVGKTTVYRWWPTKGELVLEAAEDCIAIGEVPDSGRTSEDLRIASEQLIRTFSDPLAAVVIFAAISTVDHDPELAAAFRDRHVYPWRMSAARAIQRGMERADIPPGSDVGFLLDVVVGTVIQRTLVVAHPETDGLAEQIRDLVMGIG